MPTFAVRRIRPWDSGFKLAKIAGLVPSARMRDGKHGATDGTRHYAPRARPFVSIIRYRRVRSILRIRTPKIPRFFARKKKQEGCGRGERTKKESAPGGCSRTRATKRSSFSSGAPISTDRIIHPSPAPPPLVPLLYRYVPEFFTIEPGYIFGTRNLLSLVHPLHVTARFRSEWEGFVCRAR